MVGRQLIRFAQLTLLFFLSVDLAFAQASSGFLAPVIAVWDFDNHTVPEVTTLTQLDFLSRSLSELTLGTLGGGANFKVVDRIHLQQVLVEQQIGSSVLTDADARLRLGRIMGAQRMVFGSFMAVADEIQVNLRAVDSATSQVVFADEFTSTYADVLVQAQKMSVKLARTLGAPAMKPMPAQSNQLWLAYDQVLADADAGRFDKALDALKILLAQAPDFAPAQRQLSAVLEQLARQ